MTAQAMNQSFEYALDQIDRSKVLEDPFPHLLIERLFPDEFFNDLRSDFPDRSHFQKVRYPGTGHGRRASHFHDYGLACLDLSKHPVFSELGAFFRSEEFVRKLLKKFSSPLADGTTPIPAEKHPYFEHTASDYTSVFDLQIDLPGYEIPPHPDISDKIVTFQYFLTTDDTLRDYGTIFCKPKSGKPTTERSPMANVVGRLIDRAALTLRLRRSKLYKLLEQSAFGLHFGVGTTRSWLPWNLFDLVKIIPALPNHFMAFPPNDRSYHAVRLDIPADSPRQERPVVRGFIRSGSNTRNWITRSKSVPGSPLLLDIEEAGLLPKSVLLWRIFLLAQLNG